MGGDNGWRVIQLGDLTENFDAIRIPVKESDRKPGPYPYYGASGIVDYIDSYIFDGEYLLIAEDGENLRTRKTPIAFLAGGKFWVNNHAHIVRGNKRADTRFLMYAIQHAGVNAYLTGSTMPKLTQANLNRVPILAPPFHEQRAISRILGALDNKIELNRRMNETLEAMAHALFKSWFVDFDPVRARAEGRQPAGLDADTAALFPSSFEVSSLGTIPRGWRVSSIGEIGESARRGIRPSDMLQDTPYIGLEHMPRRSIALSDWGIAGEVTSNKFAFRQGDILFGKLRPYFHKVGVAVLDGVCSTDIVVVAPMQPEWFGLLLCHLSSVEFVNAADASSTGTKMPRTNWQDMARYEIVLPKSNIAGAFTKQVQPLVEMIRCNIMQSRTLAELRDALLPKLLSGEVRVREAEREVEQVV